MLRFSHPPPPPILFLLVFAVFSAAGGDYCYDAEGRRFPDAGIAFYKDQRVECVIMICNRGGVSSVLWRLCDEEDICQPVLECPEVLLQKDVNYCNISSHETGVVCPPKIRNDDYPKRRHTDISREAGQVLLDSGLPTAGTSFLLSAPPVTADGRSAVEALIRATILNAADEILEKIEEDAKKVQQFQAVEVNHLLSSNQVPENNSSTTVFNLNFNTSPVAQSLGQEALKQLLTAHLLSGGQLPPVQATSPTRPTRPPTSQTRPTRPPTSQTRPTRPPTSQTRPTKPSTSQTRPTRPPTSQTRRTIFPTFSTRRQTRFSTPLTRPTRPSTSQTRTHRPTFDFRFSRTTLRTPSPLPTITQFTGRAFPTRPTSVDKTQPSATSMCFCQTVTSEDGRDTRKRCTCRTTRSSTETFFADELEKQELARSTRIVAPPALACLVDLPLVCDHGAIYRTPNGWCNNLEHPRWGSALTPIRRFFPNTYADGVFAPTSSPLLPGPRLVSEMVMGAEPGDLPFRTLGLMTWGQFMDHDLVHSPIFQLPDGTGIECCLPSSASPPPDPPVHPQCLPITIRAGDAFYDPHHQRCMNFVRSVPAPGVGCSLGPANQLNDITHWIDGSHIYGSDHDKQFSLREFSGGRMLTGPHNLLPLETPLPFPTGPGGGYGTSCRGRVCFVAGDSRINENPVLALYHTLFVREHNRIAGILQAAGTSDDEELFQRARRIVIAEFQHISYNEWLPALLGYGYSQAVGLRTIGSGHSSIYFGFLNPNIANVFSTAGFRLHSLVQGLIEFVSTSGFSYTNRLRETFFEPSVLLNPDQFVELARGVSVQMPQRFDRRFTSELRGQLFATECFGLDLVSLNIQRGRDHGLAKYVSVLNWCTGIVVNHWTDLLAVMTAENIERLQSVYTLWEDIDLYPGLNMESVPPGSAVGPTSRCLIAEQFLRLRYTDRFFYDLGGEPGSFTLAQVAELKQVTWARLLCDNVGGDFTQIQPFAFFQSNPIFNPVVDCDSLPEMDLSLF